jgi:hypothetical protein
MIKITFSAVGLHRITLDNSTAPGRDYDFVALMAIRPHLLAADRALLKLMTPTSSAA